MLFLDLDRFKLINDTLGHAAGDMLLIAVGGAVAAVRGGQERIRRCGRRQRRRACWTVPEVNAIVNRMPTTVAAYPDYKDQVKKLVRQHRALRGERLHLAVYLAPPKRPKRDIYLFEVIDDFGNGHIDPDKKLFTFAYGTTPGLPLPEGVRLWMILTNPAELGKAIREHWRRIGELRGARTAGKAVVLYADAKGKKFWNKIK